jgi:hypothetical protein
MHPCYQVFFRKLQHFFCIFHIFLVLTPFSFFQPPRPETREPALGRQEQHQGGRLWNGVAAADGGDARDELWVTALRLPGGHQGRKVRREESRKVDEKQNSTNLESTSNLS